MAEIALNKQNIAATATIAAAQPLTIPYLMMYTLDVGYVPNDHATLDELLLAFGTRLYGFGRVKTQTRRA
jgi:hypothetical protein